MGVTEMACKACTQKYRVTEKRHQTHRNIFQKLLGYCPCCERYFRWRITTQRRNTQYVEESANWLTACKDCHNEDDAYFDDLWQSYYSSI